MYAITRLKPIYSGFSIKVHMVLQTNRTIKKETDHLSDLFFFDEKNAKNKKPHYSIEIDWLLMHQQHLVNQMDSLQSILFFFCRC